MLIQQHAYVLHSRPYKETSALVTLLTEDNGKLNAIIRGVRGGRKPSAQKTAMLQPFQQLLVQWREKPHSSSDLISVQQFEMAKLSFPLFAEASICGLYINELLYRLLFPQVSVEGLFETYQQALYQLSRAENRAHQAWALRQFEYHLLSLMGDGLQCEMDIQQQPIETNQDYYFYPQAGARLAQQDPHKQGIKISGACLQALAADQFNADCLPALKQMFRAILALYLGDKPIMTRSLFAK